MGKRRCFDGAAFLIDLMPTFTYTEGDLTTALNWARWRVDDIDPRVRQTSQGQPAPFLWDEEYLTLFSLHGVQEGAAQAAERIALMLSKRFVRFSDGPTTVTFDRGAYEEIARKIRTEAPFDPSETNRLVSVGLVKSGVSAPTSSRRFRGVVAPGLVDTPVDTRRVD